MKPKENSKNKLEIYTIFFRGEPKFYDILNYYHDKCKNYLDEIAIEGGTEKVRDYNSLGNLNAGLKNIAHSINQHYGLKYQ